MMGIEHIEGVKYTESNMEEFRKIKDYHDGEIKAYIGFDAIFAKCPYHGRQRWNRRLV